MGKRFVYLARRLHHNISAHIERSRNISTRSKRVINDERYSMSAGNFRQFWDVGYIGMRIANHLAENGLSFAIDHCLDLARFVSIGKLCCNPKTGQQIFKLIVGTTVNLASRYNYQLVISYCCGYQTHRLDSQTMLSPEFAIHVNAMN